MSSPMKLEYHAMMLIKKYKLKSYRESISELLDYFKPTVVIVENGLDRKGKRVKAVIDVIKKETRIKRLDMHCYSRDDIRELFKNLNCSNKFEIVQFIQAEIPELQTRKGGREKPWESEAYYTPVYDAISLAMTHYYKN